MSISNGNVFLCGLIGKAIQIGQGKIRLQQTKASFEIVEGQMYRSVLFTVPICHRLISFCIQVVKVKNGMVSIFRTHELPLAMNNDILNLMTYFIS